MEELCKVCNRRPIVYIKFSFCSPCYQQANHATRPLASKAANERRWNRLHPLQQEYVVDRRIAARAPEKIVAKKVKTHNPNYHTDDYNKVRQDWAERFKWYRKKG